MSNASTGQAKAEDSTAAARTTGHLIPAHQRFIAEYLLDQNGTRAYRRAYQRCSEEAARRSASRLLTNADVRAAVDRGLTKITVNRKCGALHFKFNAERIFMQTLVAESLTLPLLRTIFTPHKGA